MRNGQLHTPYLRLSLTEAAQPFHREYKAYEGQRWELLKIEGYQPLRTESVKCTLRKWTPVVKTDADASYPSFTSVLSNRQASGLDVQYAPLKCLTSDVPNEPLSD
jgi:hypothetical protein